MNIELMSGSAIVVKFRIESNIWVHTQNLMWGEYYSEHLDVLLTWIAIISFQGNESECSNIFQTRRERMESQFGNGCSLLPQWD